MHTWLSKQQFSRLEQIYEKHDCLFKTVTAGLIETPLRFNSAAPADRIVYRLPPAE